MTTSRIARHQIKRTSFRLVGGLVAGLVSLAGSAMLRADQSANFAAGAAFSISASTDGTGPFTYQWRRNGTNIAGANAAVYSVASAQLADAGSYSVSVTNLLGSAVSDVAVIGITAQGIAAVPTISGQPTSQSVSAGATTTLSVSVTGSASIQWQRNGTNIAGATSATLTLSSATAGTAGTYTAVVTNAHGTVTSQSAIVTVSGVISDSRLVNVSVRTVPGTGSQTLIAGFVTTGGDKTVLIRGIGPGLSAYTSAATYADPKLALFQGSSDTPSQSNDNWGGTTALKTTFSKLGAFSLPDTSKDAAILTTLAPNVYSVQLSGTGSGMAMAEIYDADPTSTGRIANLSARTQVNTGDGVLIAGFVISGTTPKKLLIRAVGPTLSSYGVTGVLADPRLDLYQAGNTTAIQSNDNWGGTAELTAAAASCGAFSLSNASSKDSAMIVTLDPGAYSAVVSGVGNTTGVALVEIYELQ